VPLRIHECATAGILFRSRVAEVRSVRGASRYLAGLQADRLSGCGPANQVSCRSEVCLRVSPRESRMRLVCTIGGHRPDITIWNDGIHFSKCRRCRADIVKQGEKWIAPPPGYRIVWRTRHTDTELVLLRESIAPPADKAGRDKDRRRGGSTFLPPHLKGIDRRRSSDRRQSCFGKKATVPANSRV
jgi:hypothetical protein